MLGILNDQPVEYSRIPLMYFHEFGGQVDCFLEILFVYITGGDIELKGWNPFFVNERYTRYTVEINFMFKFHLQECCTSSYRLVSSTIRAIVCAS